MFEVVHGFSQSVKYSYVIWALRRLASGLCFCGPDWVFSPSCLSQLVLAVEQAMALPIVDELSVGPEVKFLISLSYHVYVVV